MAIYSKRPQRGGFASNRCSAESCPKLCPLATAIFTPSPAVITRSTAVAGQLLSIDPDGSRWTGWSRPERSAPTPPPDASGLAPRALRPMRCSRHPLFLQALGRLGSGVGGGACSNSGSRRQARCGPTSRSSQLGRHARSGKHQMRKSCAISGEYADRPLATPGHAANSAALVASMGRWRGLGSRHRSPKPGHARIRTW